MARRTRATSGDSSGKDSLEFQRGYYQSPSRRQRLTGPLTPLVQRHFDTTMAHLGLTAGKNVLELGCGAGRFTQLLLKAGLQVTALDLSAHLIQDLRQRHRL